MMKKILRILLPLSVLFALLMMCTEASALKKGRLYDLVWNFDNAIFYQVSTIPEGLSPYCKDFGTTGPELSAPATEGPETAISESPESISVKYVSGEKELAGMMEVDEDGHLHIRGDRATVPGTVKLRVTAKGKILSADHTITLNVIPYDSCPLLTWKVPFSPNIWTIYTDVNDEREDFQVEITTPTVQLELEGGRVYTPREIAEKIMTLSDNIVMDVAGIYSWTSEEVCDGETCCIQKGMTCDVALELGRFSVEGQRIRVNCGVPVHLVCGATGIVGPEMIPTGESVQYTLSDPDVKALWRVEGEGASISEDGLLTTEKGMQHAILHVYALPEGETTEAEREVTVGTFLFDPLDGSETFVDKGFICPVHQGASTNGGRLSGRSWSYADWNGSGHMEFVLPDNQPVVMDLMTFPLGAIAGDADEAYAWLEKNGEKYLLSRMTLYKYKNLQYEIGKIGDMPVILATFDSSGYTFLASEPRKCGLIMCPRYEHCLRIQFEVREDSDYVPFLMDMMREYIALVRYEDNHVITAEQVAVRIETEKNERIMTAGGKLRFKVQPVNPDVYKEYPYPENIYMDLKVVDSQTGMESSAVTASGNTLVAAKGITEPVKVRVIATVQPFGATDVVEITVIPPVQTVKAEPGSLILYTGDPEAVMVQAHVDPDVIPADCLVWGTSNEKVASVTEKGDGTAEVRAVGAGNATVVVSAGGKTAKIKVTVMDPVASVELSVKGIANPGKTVNVSAALLPQTARNKKVSWKVDVDESIASIDAKGRLKIAKEAAPGTVITVTCTAEGAPEPVTATVKVTVE